MQVTQFFLDQLLYGAMQSSLLDGLIAYYPFNPLLTDVSGGGFNLTNNGGVTQGSGPVNKAAVFTGGTGQFLSVASPWFTAPPFTVACLVNPTDENALYGLWNLAPSGSPTTPRAFAYINGTGFVQVSWDGGTHSKTSAGRVLPGSYTSVLVTYDGTTTDFWLNGSLDPNSSPQVNSFGSVGASNVGAFSSSSNNWKGNLAEFGVWGRVLNPQEIVNVSKGITWPFVGN